MDWPVTLADYKVHLKLPAADTRFDDALQLTLDAAIAYVERVRADWFLAADYADTVNDDMALGALMYARRLDERRNSPAMTIVAGTLGSAMVPGYDADIERLLRIGRCAVTRFA